MDELSAEELRGAATTANLRRALGGTDGGPLPLAFLSLLRRLSEIGAPPSHRTGVPRPGA